LFRISGLTALFVGIGCLILWDHARVQKDFAGLMGLLRDTRSQALKEDRTLLVRFSGDVVTVANGKTDLPLSIRVFPTLDQVNYDSTLGDGVIVFDGHGTSAYNKREHGGDVRLRSFLGFGKNIAVNCTGLATDGVYPEN
jgi:hypothetical protein